MSKLFTIKTCCNCHRLFPAYGKQVYCGSRYEMRGCAWLRVLARRKVASLKNKR